MSERRSRKEHRLANYDYSQNGAYFVTICTKNMVHYFWDENTNPVGAHSVRPQSKLQYNTKIRLSEYGKAVKESFEKVSEYYPMVYFDKYVIMPNHIHVIISISTDICEDKSGRTECAPTLSQIIKNLKENVTRKIGFSLWQKSFYDRVLRNNREYLVTWQYIENNPINWLNGIEEDEFYKGEIYND